MTVDRAFPDGNADEREVLTGFLDWQRATVHRKANGLPHELADRALLQTSPHTTVAGIVAHLRQTEHDWFAGRPVSVRWILAHMLEETARHLGHLDILREHLDGTRGY